MHSFHLPNSLDEKICLQMSKFQELIALNYVQILISLLIIFALALYNYFLKTFKRDPRLVEFAETLPGPPCLPLLGNGLDFYYGGKCTNYLINVQLLNIIEFLFRNNSLNIIQMQWKN